MKTPENNLFSLLIVFVLLALTAGCGFVPYAAKSLPPQLSHVYLQLEQPYGLFEIALKRKLQAGGTVLLATPNAAAPIIYITSSYSYSNDNPASSVQARSYNLSYTAVINIHDVNNETLLPTQTISVARVIMLQPNEAFETTPQVDIVKQEIAQELVIKAWNILSAHKTFQALQSVAR